jgi:hypothetical protein
VDFDRHEKGKRLADVGASNALGIAEAACDDKNLPPASFTAAETSLLDQELILIVFNFDPANLRCAECFQL